MALGVEMQKMVDYYVANREEIIAQRELLLPSKKRKDKANSWNPLTAPRGNVLLSMGRIATAEDIEAAVDRISKEKTTAKKELKKWTRKFVW